MKDIYTPESFIKRTLKGATLFFSGFVFALLLIIALNVVRNWKAIQVAMENPEIVSSLQVAQPTFTIKK